VLDKIRKYTIIQKPSRFVEMAFKFVPPSGKETNFLVQDLLTVNDLINSEID